VIKNYKILIFVVSVFIMSGIVNAQEGVRIINRSTTIQEINGKEYFIHAVLQGQTLFSIARAYGVTVEDIEKENQELKDHGLRYNQMIRIPVKKDEHQPPQSPQREITTQTVYTEHQVKRRETVYGISRMYNISMEELIEHNPEIRTGLRVNSVLRIPRQEERVIDYISYHVMPQQTLFSISREFNVSIEELEKLNPELRDGLKAGQILRIPVESEIQQPPFIVDPELRDEIRPVYQPVIHDPYCQNPRLKDTYNVALMIPLYLNRFESQDEFSLSPNHPSFAFMEYYEGMLIALDSIRGKGADIRLHVFDVSDSLPKTRAVLRNPEIARMDLIIGPFHPNSLELAGEFAKARNIPIISPLYNRDNQMLRKFPNMFQATPSQQEQMNEMARYVAQNHYEDNLIVVYDNLPASIQFVNEYKRVLNHELNLRQYQRDSINMARIDGYFLNGVYVGERITNVYVLNDSLLDARRHGRNNLNQAYQEYMERDNLKDVIFTREGIDGLKGKMETSRRNILISLMGGQAVISNYTRQLHQLRDSFNITIYGVPQWATYESLDIRYLQNLNVHLFTPDFVDFDARNNIDFIRRFRTENHNEPGNDAFRAVQTGVYFFDALHRYGPEFYRCIDFINESTPSNTPFWFSRVEGNESGWENKFVYLYKYQNYRIRKVSDTQKRMVARP
jgi:LysM repeat protein